MTAANRLGLNSALRACVAIFFRSSETPKFTVETMFWRVGISGGCATERGATEGGALEAGGWRTDGGPVCRRLLLAWLVGGPWLFLSE